MGVYDDFFSDSLTKVADQSVKTTTKAQASSDVGAFNGGYEEASQFDDMFSNSYTNKNEEYKHEKTNETNLESIGGFLGEMKSQIKGVGKAIGDTWDLYVHDKQEDKGIYDLSKYQEYSSKMEQYIDSGNDEEAQRYFNKMTDEGVVDFDKLKSYQIEEYLLRVDVDKIVNYKDKMTNQYINSVKSQLSKNEDSFTQEIIYEGADQMADQLSGMYSTIQESYETPGFNRIEWKNKLKMIEGKVGIFYTGFVDGLAESTDDEEVYNKLLDDEKYRGLAQEISDFYLELRDASLESSMDYYKGVANKGNTSEWLGSNFMVLSNFVSDVVNKIGGTGLEKGKQALGWGYDITEELSHLDIYKEGEPNYTDIVSYYKDELIDGIPQFLPEIVGILGGSKLFSKVGDISKISKFIDKMNNPYLKKLSVGGSELMKDIILYDMIGRGMLDRGHTSEDIATDLLISGGINSIIGVMASTVGKNNDVYLDFISQYEKNPKYIDDEIIDLFKAGKMDEGFALSLKRGIDGKLGTTTIYSLSESDEFRRLLDTKVKNIKSGMVTDGDSIALASMKKATSRKYSDSVAIGLFKNNMKILGDIKTKGIKGNTDIISKQTIVTVNNALNDGKITKKVIDNIVDSAGDTVFRNIFGGAGVDTETMKNLVKYYLGGSSINPIKDIVKPTKEYMSALNHGAKEILNLIRMSDTFLDLVPNGGIIGRYIKQPKGFKDLVTGSFLGKNIISGGNKKGINQTTEVYNKLDNMLKMEPKATIFDVSDGLGLSLLLKGEGLQNGKTATSVLNKALQGLGIKFEGGKLLANRSKIKQIINTIKNFNEGKIPVDTLSKQDYSSLQLLFLKDSYLDFEKKFFLFGDKFPNSDTTYTAFKEYAMFKMWEPSVTVEGKTVYKINLKKGDNQVVSKYIKNILKSNIPNIKKAKLINKVKTTDDVVVELSKGKKPSRIIKDKLDNINMLKRDVNKPLRNKIDKVIDNVESKYIEEGNLKESTIITTELLESNALTPATLNAISTGNTKIQTDLIEDVVNTELLKNVQTKATIKKNIIKNKLPKEVKEVAERVEKNKINSEEEECFLF